jgi:hypothetical protein
MADCITKKDRWNKILPVGGPGEAGVLLMCC